MLGKGQFGVYHRLLADLPQLIDEATRLLYGNQRVVAAV
ncbi:Uncharacterised protein [Mycobacterium tuberculosis]|uniref:Uncharacterized protein n=1 Tax=Mycobacterium tuberculosis TaxID=1773 RepID=A0A655FC96_MYCTX|nr:Uncharacterised protein [Mycobacterium tuberculosis]CKR86874.1 Uncharacterised protein [Mycobacterium tuberculosis]CNV59607.1 Uncharacterised protein [Mycobacterium tuberculosis]CNV91715.1 Uncharacterised protein [Mycobacterium tuberculosis]